MSRCSSSSCSASSVGRLAVVLVDVARPVAVLRPQRIDQLEVAGPFRGQFLDPTDGRLRRGLTGVHLLVSFAAVRGDPQPADDERQRQALADERREDHGEGQEDQQVPLRERLPVESVVGRASAAASDTTPRMPAHDTMKTLRGAGRGSRFRMPALRRRGT